MSLSSSVKPLKQKRRRRQSRVSFAPIATRLVCGTPDPTGVLGDYDVKEEKLNDTLAEAGDSHRRGQRRMDTDSVALLPTAAEMDAELALTGYGDSDDSSEQRVNFSGEVGIEDFLRDSTMDTTADEHTDCSLGIGGIQLGVDDTMGHTQFNTLPTVQRGMLQTIVDQSATEHISDRTLTSDMQITQRSRKPRPTELVPTMDDLLNVTDGVFNKEDSIDCEPPTEFMETTPPSVLATAAMLAVHSGASVSSKTMDKDSGAHQQQCGDVTMAVPSLTCLLRDASNLSEDSVSISLPSEFQSDLSPPQHNGSYQGVEDSPFAALRVGMGMLKHRSGTGVPAQKTVGFAADDSSLSGISPIGVTTASQQSHCQSHTTPLKATGKSAEDVDDSILVASPAAFIPQKYSLHMRKGTPAPKKRMKSIYEPLDSDRENDIGMMKSIEGVDSGSGFAFGIGHSQVPQPLADVSNLSLSDARLADIHGQVVSPYDFEDATITIKIPQNLIQDTPLQKHTGKRLRKYSMCASADRGEHTMAAGTLLKAIAAANELNDSKMDKLNTSAASSGMDERDVKYMEGVRKVISKEDIDNLGPDSSALTHFARLVSSRRKSSIARALNVSDVSSASADYRPFVSESDRNQKKTQPKPRMFSPIESSAKRSMHGATDIAAMDCDTGDVKEDSSTLSSVSGFGDSEMSVAKTSAAATEHFDAATVSLATEKLPVSSKECERLKRTQSLSPTSLSDKQRHSSVGLDVSHGLSDDDEMESGVATCKALLSEWGILDTEALMRKNKMIRPTSTGFAKVTGKTLSTDSEIMRHKLIDLKELALCKELKEKVRRELTELTDGIVDAKYRMDTMLPHPLVTLALKTRPTHTAKLQKQLRALKKCTERTAQIKYEESKFELVSKMNEEMKTECDKLDAEKRRLDDKCLAIDSRMEAVQTQCSKLEALLTPEMMAKRRAIAQKRETVAKARRKAEEMRKELQTKQSEVSRKQLEISNIQEDCQRRKRRLEAQKDTRKHEVVLRGKLAFVKQMTGFVAERRTADELVLVFMGCVRLRVRRATGARSGVEASAQLMQSFVDSASKKGDAFRIPLAKMAADIFMDASVKSLLAECQSLEGFRSNVLPQIVEILSGIRELRTSLRAFRGNPAVVLTPCEVSGLRGAVGIQVAVKSEKHDSLSDGIWKEVMTVCLLTVALGYPLEATSVRVTELNTMATATERNPGYFRKQKEFEAKMNETLQTQLQRVESGSQLFLRSVNALIEGTQRAFCQGTL